MNDAQGYIYVYGGMFKGEGIYKIGYTRGNPFKRCSNISVAWECKVVLSLYCLNAKLSESHIHKHFSSKNTHGEWFSLTIDDINSIPLIINRNQAFHMIAPISKRQRMAHIEVDKTATESERYAIISMLSEGTPYTKISKSVFNVRGGKRYKTCVGIIRRVHIEELSSDPMLSQSEILNITGGRKSEVFNIINKVRGGLI